MLSLIIYYNLRGLKLEFDTEFIFSVEYVSIARTPDKIAARPQN